jgi:hypothetical protein
VTLLLLVAFSCGATYERSAVKTATLVEQSQSQAAIVWQRSLIRKAQAATWKCQRKLGARPTRSSGNAKHSTDLDYLGWVKGRWQARAAKCWKQLNDPRTRVKRTLSRGLAGTPLAGSAVELEQEAWKADFNPYVIVGASGVESSYGAAACHGNPNNIWGLGACGRAWHEPYFATRRIAYRYFIRFIRSHWPNATTIYQFYGYCVPASRCGAPLWGARALGKAQQLFGPVSAGLAYPR